MHRTSMMCVCVCVCVCVCASVCLCSIPFIALYGGFTVYGLGCRGHRASPYVEMCVFYCRCVESQAEFPWMKRATTESNLNAVTRGQCKGREGAGGRIEKGEADVTHTHTHYTLKLASSVDETNSASTRRSSDVFRRSHMTFAFVIQS